jgi:hypothetical protein
MQKKKLLLIGLLLLCLPFSLHLRAQTQKECVVIETVAGQRMEYLLTEQPRIVQDDATVTFTTTNTTLELKTSEVAKVYVTTSATGIVNVTEKTSGKMEQAGDMLILTGYESHETVSLFSSDGKMLQRHATDDQGYLTIPLGQLQTGIYIIKTKQQSIKFIKK